MPAILAALMAFVREHQRCGELDGGLDDGFVWLQCSCGGLIMQPASEPPKAPALNVWSTACRRTRMRIYLPAKLASGDLDGGVDDQQAWLACDCGARISG